MQTNKPGKASVGPADRIRSYWSRKLKHRSVAEIIAHESVVFYYAFRWPGSNFPVECPPQATELSIHRDSGAIAILSALMLAVFVEMAAIHLLVAMWSELVAWIATASSVYVAILLLAQIRSLAYRPSYMLEEQMHIRNGMYDLVTIPLADIERIEATARDVDLGTADKSVRTFQATFPASHNCILFLRSSTVAELMYGQQREFNVMLMHLDEPAKLIQAWQEVGN